jgi:dihydrofolate reductase
MLPYCDELILTLVDDSVDDADVYFPEYAEQFKIESKSEITEQDGVEFCFARFVKK